MYSSSSPPPGGQLSKPQQPESTSRTSRRFAVEPVETTVKGSRASGSKNTSSDGPATRRRFVPQLEESSAKSNRKAVAISSSQETGGIASLPTQQPAKGASPDRIRRARFAPQLIETTKRSRKSGDTSPALRPSDKTDLSPGDQVHLIRSARPARPSLLPLAPENTPVASSEEVSRVPESRFSSSNLSRKAPARRSFRVPDLAPIVSQPDSEESNNSGCPSLSTSPSAASDETERYKHPTRVRESCDDRFSGYLLALAARAAEKQLRDQAMAAYPNENMHEPVDHFAVDRESDESDEEMRVGILSRGPGEKMPGLRHESGARWELTEMKRHQEKLEQQRMHDGTAKNVDTNLRKSIKSPQKETFDPVKDEQHTSDASGVPRSTVGGWKKGVELAHMRNAASPPMLGDDLIFPKCLSPRQTKMESDQYFRPRKTSGAATPSEHSGLWTPSGSRSRRNSGSGLWNGVCVAHMDDSLSTPKLMQTGLMTPKDEPDDPFRSLCLANKQNLPPSPADSPEDFDIGGIDSILSVEEEIEREFHNGFVTQIYNYLSLGYPSLARKYDVELSKISKMPVEELRRDDERANAKGYVGAPEGNGSLPEEMLAGQCGRWVALRLYIKEWARQQPRMIERNCGANNDWGVRARRGSWAI